MYAYTHTLCHSSIIYICCIHVVYFLHDFIIMYSFSSFPHSIICNPVCCDEKCFIFFLLVSGLVVIVVLFLLPCSPSLLRALIVFIILRSLFRIKHIRLGTVLRSFFPWINLNFPNKLEKLPRIDSKFLNQLEKLPWINPNFSLMSPMLALRPYIDHLYQQRRQNTFFML